MKRISFRFSSAQIILLGFLSLILAGALLLMLPFATKDGRGASFLDALFTATSASCVTGLIVQDTATYWSIFGHAVILCLIQIGGLGVVTVAVLLARLSGKKISLRQRSTMQESISAPQMGGIVKLTGFILKGTLLFELLGAILMAPAFLSEFGIGKGIWYSIFHSISAFCNAGFDLMGIKEPFSSLTYFAENPFINLGVMSLIILGGLGFGTWEDVKKHKWHLRRYRMQSKVVLVTTGALVILPSVYFFLFEFGDEPLAHRIWGSLFQSVTMRTAGFNTLDLTAVSDVGLTIMIVLMLVGGSPGSTAGGMKTTTLAVLLSTTISVFRRKPHTTFFGRRIEEETVRSAATILTMYLVLFLLSGCLISLLEGIPLLTCLFETGSAIGTVGITLGITTKLGTVSKLILISLMYLGRVGGLTLIFATVSGNPALAASAKFPKEKLTVG